jgi:hypothetical protein
MKNCGEHAHFEVVQLHVLQEMVKLVQKRVLSSSPLVAIIMLLMFTKITKDSLISLKT